MRFETLAVHAGAEVEPETGSIAPAIHLSTTFRHTPEGEPEGGFLYIRGGSPTQARLEGALAAIEGGAAALVFSSGVASGTACLQMLAPGSHVLFHDDIYYAFKHVARELLPRWGLASDVVDMGDLEATRRAIRPETKLLWAESPSNPLLRVVDLEALAGLAHQSGAKLLVDGTFATPALQRPLELGADIVLHSATKYLGGHSDVHGGALVFREGGAEIESIAHLRYITGGVASPFGSWLVLRGLRTLACRMERHSENALLLARALAGHRGVAAVYYPGIESHPGHAIARRQMSAFGGMLSIRVRGGRESALRAASRVRLFVNATSLGSVESLLEHRASVEGPDTTTPDDLIRISVGLEHPDDLIEDLTSALG